VREKQFGSKAIQLQCGLSTTIYWISHFLLDYLKYIFVASFGIIFIKVFDIDSFITLDRLGAVGVLFVLYGLAAIPFLYLMSFFFKEYGNSENAVFIANISFSAFLPIMFFSFGEFN